MTAADATESTSNQTQDSDWWVSLEQTGPGMEMSTLSIWNEGEAEVLPEAVAETQTSENDLTAVSASEEQAAGPEWVKADEGITDESVTGEGVQSKLQDDKQMNATGSEESMDIDGVISSMYASGQTQTKPVPLLYKHTQSWKISNSTSMESSGGPNL